MNKQLVLLGINEVLLNLKLIMDKSNPLCRDDDPIVYNNAVDINNKAHDMIKRCEYIISEINK